MEKEKEVNPDTDALLMIGVPENDEEAYEVIEAFKKIFNEKAKAEEGICIGKIGSCLHISGKATPTATMYGATRFFALYDINNIGCMFGEMRDNAEVQEAIKTLEKYTFTFLLTGSLVSYSTCIYGAKHKAGLPIEELTTVMPLMPFEMPN